MACWLWLHFSHISVPKWSISSSHPLRLQCPLVSIHVFIVLLQNNNSYGEVIASLRSHSQISTMNRFMIPPLWYECSHNVWLSQRRAMTIAKSHRKVITNVETFVLIIEWAWTCISSVAKSWGDVLQRMGFQCRSVIRNRFKRKIIHNLA